MTDYKATPKQWATVEKWSSDLSSTDACILELRSCVEILEATQHVHIDRVSAKLAPVAGGLVERAANALSSGPHEIGKWNLEARAVILEVAQWLRENEGDYSAVRWLENEAGR